MAVVKKELTFEDVVELRKQICFGSMFISDYENDLGVDKYQVCNFFDGYFDFLVDEAEIKDGFILHSDNFKEFFKKYDNEETLEEWWYCFDECPLIAVVEE